MDAFDSLFGGFNKQVEKTSSILEDLFDWWLSPPAAPRHALPRNRGKSRGYRPRPLYYVPKRKSVKGGRR